MGKSKVPVVTRVVEATPADLEQLRNQPKLPGTRIGKIRDWHHLMARLMAMGLTNKQVAEATGRSLQSVSNFRVDPAMMELVEEYRPGATQVTMASAAEHINDLQKTLVLTTALRLEAIQRVADGEGDPMPIRDMNAIISDTADRLGPIKAKANLNVNTLEDKLEAAWDRMHRARIAPKIIEVEALSDLRLESPALVESPSVSVAQSVPAAVPRITRRF